MKNVTLANIAQAVSGILYTQNMPSTVCEKTTEASKVVIDSRQMEPGGIFVATCGAHVDGHNFIDTVFAAGALGVICEKAPKEPKGAYILVQDSFQALEDLAEFYRNQLEIKVVGITGSVGKTSTKEFVASVLSEQYQVLKTKGNFNNEIGLPLTVLGIREECQVAVLEMGISDFGEMHRLSKVARPDVCLITNIGQCHLENLGTRDGILRAKTEIFDFMQENARVCLNGDDDKLVTIKEVKGKSPIFFGREQKNSIWADQYENKGLVGSKAWIHNCLGEKEDVFEVEIPLPGEHMLYNALAAVSVGVLFGLSTDQIQAGIRKVEPVDGRSHVMHTEKFTLIDDCYNANPISMKAAIDLLAMTEHGHNARRVAVLGDMFELGLDTDALHAQVGTYAVQKGLDMVICIGTLCKHMYEGAVAVGDSHTMLYYFKDKAEFFLQADRLLQKEDIILIKASHGMCFEEIIQRLEA